MRYALNRQDYERLMVLAGNDDMPTEERAKYLAEGYPKSTAQAVVELRSRGLDATAPVIEYLVRKGAIPEPRGDGRNRRWGKGDIDRAAEYMDGEQMYVPGTMARLVLNIDPVQDLLAQRKVFDENPDLPPDATQYVMEIVPGAPGAEVYSTVRYRPMTQQERVERLRAINAAKKV